jgi:hypothetical protein
VAVGVAVAVGVGVGVPPQVCNQRPAFTITVPYGPLQVPMPAKSPI